jgi:hypothetical protein
MDKKIITPPNELDLTQAFTLDTNPRNTEGVELLKNVLTDQAVQIQASTAVVIKKMTEDFDAAVKQVVDSTNVVLNDIDKRITTLEEAQVKTEIALDSFIKVALFQEKLLDEDLKSHMDVLNRFIHASPQPAVFTPVSDSME